MLPYSEDMADVVQDRVDELHELLLETEDRRSRAGAHLELARLAFRRRRVDMAIRHYREALILDPQLETARAALRSLGVLTEVSSRSRGTRRRMRGVWARLLRRRGRDET